MRGDILDALNGSTAGLDGPRIIEAPSREIAAALADVADRVARGQARYYLAAGSGAASRPLWAFPTHRDHAPNRLPLAMVDDILHCREEREAAIERELGSLSGWSAGGTDVPPVLIVEIFGPTSREDVGFLRACGQGVVGRSGQPRIVVLRHATRPEPGSQPLGADHEVTEILLSLWLAGGHAPAADLDRWTRERRWSPAAVASVTSHRASDLGPLCTYAGIREWAMARTMLRWTQPTTVSAMATMVTSVNMTPLIATAALGEDPAVALTALEPVACAVAARRPETLLEYGRAVLRTSLRHGWSGVIRSTAFAVYLAAFITVGRGRLSPLAADRIIGIAERAGVDAQVRSLLSYDLGQILAKARGAACWDASMRHFSYARACVQAGPSASASRVAASYNGEALARYRAGDHDGAVRAELAGLAALTAPGVPATIALAEQRVLLLTNLADVYARVEPTGLDAIRCGRQALRIALDADSLVALTYLVPGLVRRLLDRGRHVEAERVASHLLRRYDQDAAPRRAAERAVVNVCCQLASAQRSRDAAGAAAWYSEAALRMRRANPDALDGIVRNLRADDSARTAATVGRLNAELTAQLAARAHLSPLVTLLDRQ